MSYLLVLGGREQCLPRSTYTVKYNWYGFCVGIKIVIVAKEQVRKILLEKALGAGFTIQRYQEFILDMISTPNLMSVGSC